MKMKLWNLTLLPEYGNNWWTTRETRLWNFQPKQVSQMHYFSGSAGRNWVLSTTATLHWCSSILLHQLEVTGSLLAWSLSLAEKKRLPSPTAKNHQGFQTPCFSRLLLFRLLWWLDNTWPGRCVYFVSAPGRDEGQMMDGEWVKVRGGERQMSVRDVEK